jgi:hypothetical protein
VHKFSSKKTAADKAGMSEAEQIALQQRMFAEARAQSLTLADMPSISAGGWLPPPG